MDVKELIEELERLHAAGFTKAVGENGQPAQLVPYVTTVYEDEQWKNVAGVAINDTR